MLIQEKIGTLQSFVHNGLAIDILELEWHETNRRILHKTTAAGVKVTLKFLKEDPAFVQDDVIFENKDFLVAINILPADSIVVRPLSMQQMAMLCYEIGNKHLPLFIDGEDVLMPFEPPLFKWLSASGFAPSRQSRKLLNPVKTTTMAHSHVSGGNSLFSKIMQLTKNSDE